MAKDKITEYDSTANNNTVCGDVNIAENSALPSDMNNFAREIMSHLKEGLGSGTPLYVDQTNNRVGIGTSSPASSLSVASTSNTGFSLEAYNATDSIIPDISMQKSGSGTIGTKSTTANGEALGQIRFVGIDTANNSRNGAKISSYQDASATSGTVPAGLRFDTNGSEAMRINSSGNVGIGTSSPSGASGTTLAINGSSGQARLALKNTSTGDASGDGFQLSVGTDGSVGIEQRENNYMALYTNATERMRIDANGSITSTAASGNMASFASSTNAVEFKILSPTGNVVRLDTGTSDVLAFAPAGTEAMRIDSSGNVLVGKTSVSDSTNGIQLRILGDGSILGSTRTSGEACMLNRNGSSGTLAQFKFQGTNCGTISVNTNSTAYNTSSDHRLKENVTADWDATTRLKQLNPVRFNFIADADTTVDGFLAHEVQSVIPEAISGTHNEVDDDGNPVYQGIDQSKLVPLLVKTIQELEARIVALETA